MRDQAYINRGFTILRIRRILFGESDLYKSMRLESLREAPHAFSTTYESALQRSAESWREQADHSARGDDRATFIAFADDAPIGIAAVYRLPDRADVGEALQVWVAPEYRGKHVAWNLMDALFQWAGDKSFRVVIAKIKRGNDRSLRFYRNYGFIPENEASSEGLDEVGLIRNVKPGHSDPEDSAG